ncbi:MAG: PKD domain-containing protein [Candidatus Acetothermia bacterium]|nr:PKD domain-containing protein [Candidatus Acetothermia bacterium]MDH7505021.1 PKD domain-containing protein [Candidatus Acetothermia bacterium]
MKAKLTGLSLVLALVLLAAGPLAADPLPLAGAITISKTVRPELINPRGQGAPDRATVTITVSGSIAGERLPLDLVFVVDRSATMDMAQVKAAVAQTLALLGARDRIGLVSFADDARTEIDLVAATAENKAELLQLVSAFPNRGRTACDAGVAQATALLQAQGQTTAIWAELLLTDGTCTHGHEPEAELAEAVALGIAPLIVAVGPLSQAFPAKIRDVPGVKFFSSPAFFLDYLERTLREIAGLVARDLVLIERLPSYIHYEGGASELPSSIDPSGDLVIEWRRERLESSTRWQISFLISAEKTGRIVVEAGGELRFRNLLTDSPMPALPLPQATITVRNAAPVCAFTYEPAKPTTADDVNFYDQSVDAFGGTIVSWQWDFGDGSGSPKRNPSHRYTKDGSYLVKLQVTDEEGATCETSQTITVGLVEVLASRTILTFPNERVLPGRAYEAEVTIVPKVCINGMGLQEVYPQGWGIELVDSGEARFRPPNEWIWQGPLCPPAEAGVRYRAAVPPGTAVGRYAISGTVSSFSPRIDIRVAGLSTLDVVERLSIEVAIACLDVAANEPDPASCYDAQGRVLLKPDQIERAKEFYQNGQPVPGTGGALIDYEMMLRLLAYYQTGTPVTQPLP